MNLGNIGRGVIDKFGPKSTRRTMTLEENNLLWYIWSNTCHVILLAEALSLYDAEGMVDFLLTKRCKDRSVKTRPLL